MIVVVCKRKINNVILPIVWQKIFTSIVITHPVHYGFMNTGFNFYLYRCPTIIKIQLRFLMIAWRENFLLQRFFIPPLPNGVLLCNKRGISPFRRYAPFALLPVWQLSHFSLVIDIVLCLAAFRAFLRQAAWRLFTRFFSVPCGGLCPTAPIVTSLPCVFAGSTTRRLRSAPPRSARLPSCPHAGPPCRCSSP